MRDIIKEYAAGERDFQQAYLQEANLQGAVLQGADFQEADFQEANLQGADLHWVNLQRANLRGTNLRGADLRGADLRGAGIRGADLRGADLRGAGLRGANLRGTNLRGANLRGADLRRADLRGADLCFDALPGISFFQQFYLFDLSDDLKVELMRRDADYHPHPEYFQVWADGGACPYRHTIVERVWRFKESRTLYKPSKPQMTDLELAKEICKNYGWGYPTEVKDGND